ncbi:MAG: DUF2333 family protein [bacterium]|nr:DUF2333 family protein [bacterium]
MGASQASRGQAAVAIPVVVLLLILIVPLVLHFTQKRHDVLPMSVTAEYPRERPIVSGEVFGTTVAAIMDHELNGGTGWRPNDFVLWGPSAMADNNANRQLGILQAIRESTRVLKDHLTKVSATEFDPNLVVADTAFRNDATRFWLPSAESKFREGTAAMRAYVAGLRTTPPTSKPIARRNAELIRLFQSWTDLLGDAHGMLYRDRESDGGSIPPWRTDDYFYYAQGMAHVLHHLTLATAREYEQEIASRAELQQLFTEVADALGRAAVLKPVVVLDGGPASVIANHRRNLDVYIVEARQKMFSIRDELEK